MAEISGVKIDQAALDELVSPSGPIGQEILRRARMVHGRAQQFAPVSSRGAPGNPPGWLREHLELQPGRDPKGHFVDLVTTARSRDGFAYGTLEEIRRPYIRKAVTSLFGGEVSSASG